MCPEILVYVLTRQRLREKDEDNNSIWQKF
jgi:hypothetical protein